MRHHQHGLGRSNWSLKCVNFEGLPDSKFYGVLGGSVSFRYQLERYYDFAKTLVSSNYHCDVYVVC